MLNFSNYFRIDEAARGLTEKKAILKEELDNFFINLIDEGKAKTKLTQEGWLKPGGKLVRYHTWDMKGSKSDYLTVFSYDISFNFPKQLEDIQKTLAKIEELLEIRIINWEFNQKVYSDKPNNNATQLSIKLVNLEQYLRASVEKKKVEGKKDKER